VSLVCLDYVEGVIDIEVKRDSSPTRRESIVALVRHGYYDEARFFRRFALIRHPLSVPHKTNTSIGPRNVPRGPAPVVQDR
jgi:cyclophilin family peptidyl-prolyl cis-trans isomerase